MSTAQIKAIWPVIKLWLVVALAFVGCVSLGGLTYDELNVWWLLAIGCWFDSGDA